MDVHMPLSNVIKKNKQNTWPGHFFRAVPRRRTGSLKALLCEFCIWKVPAKEAVLGGWADALPTEERSVSM